MKIQYKIAKAAILSAFLATSIAGSAAESADQPAKKEQKKQYPLTTCVVSGEKLGSMGDAYVYKHNGREVQLCCEGCVEDFKSEPAKYLQKLDEAEAKAAGLKPYTLTTCVVSDEKLGSMGEPYIHAYKDRQVKFCCKGCLKDFNQEPAKFIKKIEAAEAKAKAKARN